MAVYLRAKFKSMKKSLPVQLKTLALLIFLLLSTVAQAQSEKSLLWEISGKGLEQSSYLFGTMHIVCSDDFKIPNATKEALSNTHQLVLEIDMDDPNMLAETQSAMMDMNGIDYKGKLSEMAYNKLDSVLKATVGMGMQVGRLMKPFAIMSMATISLLPCSETTAYETEFMQLVKPDGKEVLGLETATFQMSIFDDIPQEEQIGWIEDMLSDPTSSRAEFNEMNSFYMAQDVEGLYSAFEDSREYEKYEGELLINRNKNWIPKMAEMMEDKASFFAVGAMHLGGKEGVISLLRKAGYTVKAVENK